MKTPVEEGALDARDEPAIVVQRLITVAEIVRGNGRDSLIEAAWKAAGNYLATQVGTGVNAAVQFTYDGVTHHASVVLPD
jgi:hypothetical protein